MVILHLPYLHFGYELPVYLPINRVLGLVSAQLEDEPHRMREIRSPLTLPVPNQWMTSRPGQLAEVIKMGSSNKLLDPLQNKIRVAWPPSPHAFLPDIAAPLELRIAILYLHSWSHSINPKG